MQCSYSTKAQYGEESIRTSEGMAETEFERAKALAATDEQKSIEIFHKIGTIIEGGFRLDCSQYEVRLNR